MGVYVFGEPGALLVKVGVSDRPRARAQALRRNGGSGEMLYVSSPRATQMTERHAHRLLRARFWVEGEWFCCGESIAKAAVRRAVKVQRRKAVASHRKTRLAMPEGVKRVLAIVVRERRPFTAQELQQIEDAWRASGMRRPIRRGPKRVAA